MTNHILFPMSLDILRRLDIREDIVLQILELRLLLRFLQIAIRQHIIAEAAVNRLKKVSVLRSLRNNPFPCSSKYSFSI